MAWWQNTCGSNGKSDHCAGHDFYWKLQWGEGKWVWGRSLDVFVESPFPSSEDGRLYPWKMRSGSFSSHACSLANINIKAPGRQQLFIYLFIYSFIYLFLCFFIYLFNFHTCTQLHVCRDAPLTKDERIIWILHSCVLKKVDLELMPEQTGYQWPALLRSDMEAGSFLHPSKFIDGNHRNQSAWHSDTPSWPERCAKLGLFHRVRFL